MNPSSASSSPELGHRVSKASQPLAALAPTTSTSFQPVKYLVVTGGTLSGLGKGTTISSIGVALKSLGFRVTAIKIDPYLNIDAGTMSPYEHGEVYVLEDGGEVDLDLGNYERFLDITLTRDHNITTGKIYDRVIGFEREGRYLGRTVQVVPHVTNAVQAWIQEVARRPVDSLPGPPDICLIEVGGTVGDIESQIYLEALQQFSYHVGLDNFCLCHVSFVPIMGTVGEQKTKPAQHSVREVRESGLKPDFIFCRCEQPVNATTRHKVALFGQVPPDHVISVHDVPNIYHVPAMIAQQDFGSLLCQRLKLIPRKLAPGLPGALLSAPRDLDNWARLADRTDSAEKTVRIGIIGKYTGLVDSYLSVVKALRHSTIEANLRLEIEFVESSDLEDETLKESPEKHTAAWDALKNVDGVLCPGGFGDRGIIGKALSARYCRKNNVPYFGICLGMQTAVIDFARDVLGFDDANSEEFDPNSEHKVVIFMPEVNPNQMGGTMRLGNRATIVRDTNCLAYKLYDQKPVLYERHRHRYEVNPEYVSSMEQAGLRFVGQDEKAQRMEIIELENHPFFFCCQYHPEFTSRPLRPNPCFLGFILASSGRLEERLERNGGKLCPGRTYSGLSTSSSAEFQTDAEKQRVKKSKNVEQPKEDPVVWNEESKENHHYVQTTIATT